MIRWLGYWKTKWDNAQITIIEQVFAVKLLANWATLCKMLHYVLDMLSISEQYLKVVIINMFQVAKTIQRVLMLNLSEPIKVVHLQKWANQPIFNGAIGYQKSF